jgi:hypothetical protein
LVPDLPDGLYQRISAGLGRATGIKADRSAWRANANDTRVISEKNLFQIDWFLLESEAPRPETNRRIGIQGLYSVSPAMHNRAIRYLNTYS